MNKRGTGLRVRVLLMTMLVACTAVAAVGWYSSRITSEALTRQLQPMSTRDLARVADTISRLLVGSHDWKSAQHELERTAARTGKQIAIFDSSGRAVAVSSASLSTLNLRFSEGGLLAWQDSIRTTDSSGGRTTVSRLRRVLASGASTAIVRDRTGAIAGTAIALPATIEFGSAQSGADNVRRSLFIGVIVAVLGALFVATVLARPIVIAAALGEQENIRRAMTSDIAHELRGPLTNIRCQIESLQDGVALPDTATLESLHDEAVMLQRLVDDLQDLTLAEQKRLRLAMGVQDLQTDLNAVAQTFRQQAAAANVAIRVAPPAGPTLVLADGQRLRQVLGNLLSNALRHAPGGSVIDLDVRQRGADVVMTVRDSGPGISAQDQPRVFERFYRADESRTRARGGSGLGLAIVKEIVELHGGRTWLESTPGGGATFRVAFPVYRPA